MEQSNKPENKNKEHLQFLKELSDNSEAIQDTFENIIAGYYENFAGELFQPSIIKILEDVFECKQTSNRSRYKIYGSIKEIDVLGFSENDCFVVQIESKLSHEHINKLENTLNNLNSFSKTFTMYNKIGIMAATEYNEEIVKKVISSGFYFMGVNDYLGELRIVPDFKPRIWK